jgi:hypothetical protein
MGKFKNIRFDLPIMFCLIVIFAVVVYMVKAVKSKIDEANRPTLQVYAISQDRLYRPDLPPLRSIRYSVNFPGLPNQPSDEYVDDCTNQEPGFLHKVRPAGSVTTYLAEPGIVTNPMANLITERMYANFERLKKHLAEHRDVSQIDWSQAKSGQGIFNLTIKLPADFPTALP